MRLRDAAKWIKEKITGKKAEETPVLTPMVATEEDIEKAKEMDRIDSSRIITTELVKAQRLMKILMTNNGRRRKGIPMVRRQQLLRAERNQRRRRSENRKES